MAYFIPSYHFEHPSNKLKPEWCKRVIDDIYYNTSNRSLLYGKNVEEINKFAIGEIDMKRFKIMFKSLKRNMANAQRGINGEINDKNIEDKTGLSWEPLPLIPAPLKSAINKVAGLPVEVSVEAQDGLAMKKRDQDIEFLKMKPKAEKELQEFADQLNIGKVDIGTTKHGSQKFSEAPMGMDLSDPDEETVFKKLMYSLGVESANEKVLNQIYSLKRANVVKLLEIRDQFYYGVSANQTFKSSLTGLPDIERLYPGDVECPMSDLPDYSDRTHQIVTRMLTVDQMINHFNIDEKEVFKILNENGGYSDKNGVGRFTSDQYSTRKVEFKYIEVKSIDWIGVGYREKSKIGAKYLTTDETKAKKKIWAQNTYCFWWLLNTKYFYGIEKLPFAYRTRGVESFQNFSVNVYRSQDKSIVENCIGENKKAQIADIKLEHAIIKSAPSGKYIDLKYLRNALTGLTVEGLKKFNIHDLLDLIYEHNTAIGDTTGFEGKNDGQQKPVFELPGGLKNEAVGYIEIIINAVRNISRFTGINEQLTGQASNPEGLIGMQKLLINSSINSLTHIYDAVKHQHENIYNLWAFYIKQAIEEKGKTREAIVNMIGNDHTDLIDSLDETPIHNLTLRVVIGQSEFDKQLYEIEMSRLKNAGIISTADEYILSGIVNTKERFGYLAIKEKRFHKNRQLERQQDIIAQQQIVKQQGDNVVLAKREEVQGDISVVYAKGEVEAKILQLSQQLGLSKAQVEYLQKLNLQRDRNQAQKDKLVSGVRERANIEQQRGL